MITTAQKTMAHILLIFGATNVGFLRIGSVIFFLFCSVVFFYISYDVLYKKKEPKQWEWALGVIVLIVNLILLGIGIITISQTVTTATTTTMGVIFVG